MFEHSTFIIAAYGAAAVILGWCALVPLWRGRQVRARLVQALHLGRLESGR